MGGLLGGGEAKGMLAALSNYWGGEGPPCPPPLPTPMFIERVYVISSVQVIDSSWSSYYFGEWRPSRQNYLDKPEQYPDIPRVTRRYLAGIWCKNDAVLTSMRRDYLLLNLPTPIINGDNRR